MSIHTSMNQDEFTGKVKRCHISSACGPCTIESLDMEHLNTMLQWKIMCVCSTCIATKHMPKTIC